MTKNVIVIDARDKAQNYRPDPTIPFNRFYLVKDIEELNRLVPFSIIVPLTDAYAECLHRFKLDAEKLAEEGYKVVVPVNMSRLRGSGGRVSNDEVRPTYIANRRWWRRPAKLADFIPEDVSLVTPSGTFTPMCVSCEWSLQHLAGECHLGTKDCLEHMRIQHKAMDERHFEREEEKDLVQLKKQGAREDA